MPSSSPKIEELYMCVQQIEQTYRYNVKHDSVKIVQIKCAKLFYLLTFASRKLAKYRRVILGTSIARNVDVTMLNEVFLAFQLQVGPNCVGCGVALHDKVPFLSVLSSLGAKSACCVEKHKHQDQEQTEHNATYIQS